VCVCAVIRALFVCGCGCGWVGGGGGLGGGVCVCSVFIPATRSVRYLGLSVCVSVCVFVWVGGCVMP